MQIRNGKHVMHKSQLLSRQVFPHSLRPVRPDGIAGEFFDVKLPTKVPLLRCFQAHCYGPFAEERLEFTARLPRKWERGSAQVSG